MNARPLFRISLIALLSILTVTLSGQGIIPQATTTELVQEEGDTIMISAYRSTDITDAFIATNALLSESGKKHLDKESIQSYLDEVDTLFAVIDDFLGDSIVITLEDISIREMEQVAQRAGYYQGEIDQVDAHFTQNTTELEEVMLSLDLSRQRWVLTLESGTEEEMLETRMERIKRTIFRIDSVSNLLKDDMQLLLGMQDQFADKKEQLEAVDERVREAKDKMSERLFAIDNPNLFRALSELGDSTLVSEHSEKIRNSYKNDTDILKKGFMGAVGTSAFFLVFFIILALWYRRNLEKMVDVENFSISDDHRAILNAPVASAIFFVTLLVRFLVADLPTSYMNIILVLMMIPMTFLLIRLFGRSVRAWVIVLILLYILTFLYELSYNPGIILRLTLLAISIVGLWLFIWLIRYKPFSGSWEGKIMSRIFRLLILLFMGLEFVALVANIAGAVQLAEFLSLLPIQITILAIAILVSIRMADTIVYLVLASNYMQKLNVVKEEFEVIYHKVVRLIDLFLWLFFFTTALRFFRLKDVLFEWGRGVLTDGIKIGAVDVTLGNILLMIFVIWLSVIITRIISHILEKDVFTRVKMSKGMPSTIILLLRIVLISAGFFLAIAAAGMKLTNLSIVLGAFSVGIGFGLQNIFNNMVSGLILAFERPIKVGDVVQVGDLIGTVRSIGLRSSTVRSFDGSEVIVPNGNLISNQMINWTKADPNRRMDIRIGVAYGTDPEEVMDILMDLAGKHEKVRKVPKPSVYFNEFGDSALEFRLLAWCHIDNRLTVESEIKVELNRRLKEAGIEIPFPQSDLHLRTDDTLAQKTPAKKAPAKKAPAKKAPAKKVPPKKS